MHRKAGPHKGEKMAFFDESSLKRQTTADFFLAELTRQYPVKDKFLKGFIPRVHKIFEYEISDEQRESLLKLARESIIRQAETEALLREAASVLDQLVTPTGTLPSRSRRQRPSRQNPLQDEESNAVPIPSAG